jgi:hypoxanthine phosphoribosyltransferase
MALITVGGDPGCRVEEAARGLSHRLGWELVTDARLLRLLEEEFGSASRVPARAYGHVVLSVLAKLATERHLVTSAAGTDLITHRQFPALLRVHLTALDSWRVGTVMLERRLDRKAAAEELAHMDAAAREQRRLRTGRSGPRTGDSDLILNSATLDSDAVAETVAAATGALRLSELGLLSAAAEAQIQFRVRLELAKHGMSPPDRLTLKRTSFVHPSEEMFANLLDFYRIAWEYEPRSFPIQWDKDGRVMEAFTPDFYLPEFDLYLELTTAKQANVTRKNRKIKLVKQLYPHLNIRVFYQKDFENLIFKHGLADRTPVVPA